MLLTFFSILDGRVWADNEIDPHRTNIYIQKKKKCAKSMHPPRDWQHAHTHPNTQIRLEKCAEGWLHNGPKEWWFQFRTAKGTAFYWIRMDWMYHGRRVLSFFFLTGKFLLCSFVVYFGLSCHVRLNTHWEWKKALNRQMQWVRVRINWVAFVVDVLSQVFFIIRPKLFPLVLLHDLCCVCGIPWV